MQVSTELRAMFSYSIIRILLLIIVLVIIIVWNKKKNKVQNETIPEIIIPKHKDIITIKRNYLEKINVLANQINTNSISNRKAYQTLSSIIRNFIFEVTNIRVQNYTLKDIEKINMPILYELVKEYYKPEFARNEKGNITNSLEKTRMVIERWN